MKYIDLALICYDSGEKEICKAPFSTLYVGDKVETDFNFGTVEEVEYIEADSKLLRMMQKERKVHRVHAIVKELKYDLPEERND